MQEYVAPPGLETQTAPTASSDDFEPTRTYSTTECVCLSPHVSVAYYMIEGSLHHFHAENKVY